MTPSQETKRVYSFNPEPTRHLVHMGHSALNVTRINTLWMKKKRSERWKHCTRAGCSKVWTPPTRPSVTHPQTGPITIHCAACRSVQCKYQFTFCPAKSLTNLELFGSVDVTLNLLSLHQQGLNSARSHLSPSSINLVPEQAGKVTVGLASHWPCVTDNSGITNYGLTALGREMSTPPKLQQEYGTLYLF